MPWELARDRDGRRLLGRRARSIVRLAPDLRPDEMVRAVQAALGLPVDGVLGPRTMRRLADIQRAAGLRSDGELDTGTVLAVRSVAAPARAQALVIRASGRDRR